MAHQKASRRGALVKPLRTSSQRERSHEDSRRRYTSCNAQKHGVVSACVVRLVLKEEHGERSRRDAAKLSNGDLQIKSVLLQDDL